MIEEAIIMLSVLIGLIALGMPIPFSIGFASCVGLYFVGLPFIAIVQSAYVALEPIPLVTVPLFVLAGALMERCGIASRIVGVATSLIGNYAGSLALISILGCTIFAALSGSGPATTAAVGAITIPSMLKDKYDPAYSGAILAAGGALGSLIPPSNLMIFYGIISDNSIPRIFLAGVLPGIIASAVLMMVAWIIAKRRGFGGKDDSLSREGFLRVVWRAKWALFAPVVILGGIYSGVFTVTEAASVAVFYALFVGLFIYRELSIRNIIDSLKVAAVLAGTVCIIMSSAAIFGEMVTLMEIPEMAKRFLLKITNNPFIILIIISLIFIITGTFMESIAQIILFTPLMLPITNSLGIDPLLLGVVMVISCEIGFLTPPVGVNLFVAVQLTGIDIGKISIQVLPLLAAFFVVIITICLYPQIALVLPRLIYGTY